MDNTIHRSTGYRRTTKEMNKRIRLEERINNEVIRVDDNNGNQLEYFDNSDLRESANNVDDSQVDIPLAEDPDSENDVDDDSINESDLFLETEFLESSCSEDEDDQEEEQFEFVDVARKLAEWSTKHHISNYAMDDLLSWFQKYYFPSLPKNAKTLKSEARSLPCQISKMGEGKYLHFGLKEMIEVFIMLYNIDLNLTNNFIMYFGIDGIPISKSSKSNFWPILLNIKGYKLVLPIGVYHGKGKPSDINVYLEKFLTELDDVLKNGLLVNSKQITMEVGTFVMDAQAKCLVLDIKGPTGFYGCPKCKVKGRKVGPRIVFLSLHESLRTDEDFLDINDPHHRSTQLTPLANVVNCISSVCIDYMHNVLLGVFKYLLNFWTDKKYNGRSFSLSEQQKSEIDRRIISIQNQVSVDDFARRPRPLTELKHFKATEFRSLLLYFGPLAFAQVLDEPYYKHFLLLHSAIRILCHPKYCLEKNSIADQFLKRFVEDFKFLYGNEFLVYNVHVLSHLAAECVLYQEPLDGFSAFAFEEYLHKMTKMTKKAPYPLEQMKNRLMEHVHYNSSIIVKNLAKAVRIPGSKLYEEIVDENGTMFNTSSLNGNIYCSGEYFKIIQIRKSNNNFKFICYKVNQTYSLYSDPFISKDLGISCSNNESDDEVDEEFFELDAVNCSKVSRVVLDGCSYYFTILHTEK